MIPKRHLSTNKTCQNHFKSNLPILATEVQIRIITQIYPNTINYHTTSFPINYKNDSNIMVERDGSNVSQQNSKEHKTKKQNHNHQTNSLPGTITGTIITWSKT